MGVPATPDQRAKALEIYKTKGPSEAGRITGFSKAAICKWAKAEGVTTTAPALNEKATEASVARRHRSQAEWREEMSNLLRDISEQSARLELSLIKQRGEKTPPLEKVTAARVKSVSDLLLLSGEATSRVGLAGGDDHAAAVAKLRDDLAERRKAHGTKVKEA